MHAVDPGKVVLEGALRGLFTGFAESDRKEPYPVFEFTTGERFQQAEPFYHHFGWMTNPPARIIQRGEDLYLQILQAPLEPSSRPPRPVRVRQRCQSADDETGAARVPSV